jgi:hypothetical protein
MVDVVREPHRDAALRCTGEGVDDGLSERAGQPEVVERDVERLLRAAEELDEGVRNLVGGLAPVGERPDLDQVFARSDALYARFFSWYSASASGESTSPRVGCVGATSAAAATP